MVGHRTLSAWLPVQAVWASVADAEDGHAENDGLSRRPATKQRAEISRPLYLLHGGGGDEDAWLTMGRVNIITINDAAKKARPST